jgi:hypothetical protein
VRDPGAVSGGGVLSVHLPRGSQARPARQRPAGHGKRPLIGCHRPGRRETVCLLYCIWSLRVKMGSVVVLLCAGIKRSAYRDRQQRFQTQSHDRHTGHNAPYLVHVCSARFETWWQCPPEMLCGLLEYGTRTPYNGQRALIWSLRAVDAGNPLRQPSPEHRTRPYL